MHVVSIPIEHPLMILYCQVLLWGFNRIQMFFSLYFEMAEYPISAEYARFGYRFLVNQQLLIRRIEQVLLQCVSHYVDSPVAKVFNGMSLWLNDGVLKTADISYSSLPANYEVFRLKTCLASSSSEWTPWQGLVSFVPLILVA
jgi:hypothetical protein